MRKWMFAVPVLAIAAATGVAMSIGSGASTQQAAVQSKASAPPAGTRAGARTAPADWGVSTGWDDEQYRSSQALCRSVRHKQVPAGDRPDAAQRTALLGCDSAALHYGIGMKADPVRARQCAIIEVEDGHNDWGFSGRAMLMTIYANGIGGQRDLDLAIRFACTIHAAPAEYEGRVAHLADMKAQAKPKPFHYCDDISSGSAGGECAEHFSRFEVAKRNAAFGRLAAGWSPQGRAAFARLREAQKIFSEAQADAEVGLGGTLRGSFVIERQEQADGQFAELLTLLAAGKLGPFSTAEARASDAALNARYQASLKPSEEDRWLNPVEVRRDAQRKWLLYRDAFLDFSGVQYPRVSRDTVLTGLNRQRLWLIEEGPASCVEADCPKMKTLRD